MPCAFLSSGSWVLDLSLFMGMHKYYFIRRYTNFCSSCLFIKTWALYQVWRNAVRYQKANLTPLYIIKCLCLAVTVEIVSYNGKERLLLIYTYFD